MSAAKKKKTKVRSKKYDKKLAVDATFGEVIGMTFGKKPVKKVS